MADDRPEQRLVLWDIDHTLIETRGVGRALYRAAFEDVTGQPMRHEADVSGKTEPAILAETLRMHGISSDDDLRRKYAQALASQYELHRDELRQKGRSLPGARASLETLARDERAVQAVLTGNLRTVALIKLEAFDLDSFVDLEVSAYGEDGEDRTDLIQAALRRAADKYGKQFTSQNTVVVGDTINDVAAAGRAGVAVVAVATGRDGPDELLAAGAAVVLADLSDTVRVVGAVMDSKRRGQS